MKKIEIIWRELLFQVLAKKNRQFAQKDLAEKFSFSTSTVFQALKVPRKMGAVRVTGRYFILEDPEKLLYHWASVRDFKKEIIFTGHLDLPVLEIEGRMPPEIIFGAFSAARRLLTVPPADYDRVYIYAEKIDSVKQRFKFKKGRENLIVLQADKFLEDYGQLTTLSQTFVDLWNLPDWYAKEYVQSLKEKIDEFLS